MRKQTKKPQLYGIGVEIYPLWSFTGQQYLHIRLGKRHWAFRLKGWHGLLLGVFFCLLIALVLRLVAIDRWAWLNGLAEDTCC